MQELGTMAKDMNLEFQVDCVNTFNTVWIIKQAIEKAQSFDTDKVVDTLEKTDVYTPWSEAKASWMGEEYGYIHQLVLDKVPMTRLTKSGELEFEYIKRN